MVKNVTFQNPIHQEENTPLVTVLETRLDLKQSTAVDSRQAAYVIDLTKGSFGGIVYPKPGTQWLLKKISGVWALMARAPQQNPQLSPSFTPAIGETYIGNEGTTHIVGNLAVAGSLTVGGGGADPDIGAIRIWPRATPPTAHLICDGSAVSRTTYPDLFAGIGTTYGAGDGSTTFNIPNLKGRVVAGFDAGQAEFNTLGGTGGEKTHILVTSEMPVHNHTVSAITVGNQSVDHTHSVSITTSTESTTHTHTIGADNDTASGSFGYSVHRGAGGGATTSNASSGQSVNHTHTVSGSTAGTSATHNHALTGNTDNAGSGSAHNNLQPYMALYFIIKALSTGMGGGGGGGSDTDSLAGLSDVTITSPVANQVLEYNGTKWVNVSAPPGTLAGLTDVTITSIADRNVLQYSGGLAKWQNQTGLLLAEATAATAAQSVKVTGDTNERHIVGADGKHNWGTGAAATDTNLYRSGVGILATDGSVALAAGQQVNIGASGSSASFAAQNSTGTQSLFAARVTGDANSRWFAQANGALEWSDGTNTSDTNLYRSAAGVVKTDNSLVVGTNFTVGTVQVDPSSPATANVLRYNGTKYASAALAESDITNLTTDLAAKQPLATITAKGDLYAGTASATTTNLSVGTNNQVLVADSTQTTGLRWANSPGGTPVATRMISNAFQSVANTTFAIVSFTSTVFDTNLSWNIANPTRFTCKIAGYYLCNANISWATSNGGTQRTLIWQVNGTQINGSDGVVPQSTGAILQSASPLLIFLNVNDYVELGAYQDSGGALNIGNNSYAPAYNAMSVSLVGSSTSMTGPTIRAGTISQFAGASAPNGWVFCDGTSYLRTQFPDLFNSIGTTYGSVDGTHFTVPNFNGRVALGVGASSAPGATSHALATTGGEETHTMTTGELVSHNHNVGGSGVNSVASYDYTEIIGGGNVALANIKASPLHTITGNYVSSTGSTTPFNELPPYLTVNFIIKTSDSADIVNGSVTNVKLAWDIFTTKGDIVAATGASAASRLAVGTNGQVLTADSTQTTGLKYASPYPNTAFASSVAVSGSTSSASYVNLGLSATITKKFASSVLLCHVTGGYWWNGNTTVSVAVQVAGTDYQCHLFTQSVSSNTRWSFSGFVEVPSIAAGSQTVQVRIKSNGTVTINYDTLHYYGLEIIEVDG